MKPSDMKDKPITEIIRELGYVGGESDYSPETRELRLPSTYSKLYATDPKVDFETIFLHKGVSEFNPFLVRCLKGFVVDLSNPCFLSLDGVLYSKDGDVLIKAPEEAEIKIPSEVRAIGEAAFKGSKIKSLVISNNVIAIGRNAFEDCPNLEFLFIPKSVAEVGVDAFKEDTKLTIYTEWEKKPEGWAASLGDNVNILWGQSRLAKGER